MSSIYVSEPPTKGKVVLNTTHGPLDIELWPKEAPKAVRNFVQLCVDGYYDNTIFHRIIKDFMVQGGDPTGTGTGGESIYGGTFGDEFHSRLRFNHRGLVACANAGSPNSNGSQFFMTLDRCEWLDKKHTIFGKVTGDSLYNLPNLGDIETDKNDRPLESPPKIISVEVLWNPFDDIVPRAAPAKSLPSTTSDTSNRETKKKVTKKLNLLSFGEEAEEEEKELAAVKTKIKSSHDVLDDPRLLKEENSSNKLDSSEVKAKRDLQLSVRETLSSRKEVQKEPESAFYNSLNNSDDDDEASFDVRMRQQILKKKMELDILPTKTKKVKGSSSPRKLEKSPARWNSLSIGKREKSIYEDEMARALRQKTLRSLVPIPITTRGHTYLSKKKKSIESSHLNRSNAESDDDQPKVEKLSLKKKGVGSDVRAERMANADVDLQLLGQAERERQMQKQKRRRRQGHEDEVLAKLEKFKASMSGSNGKSCDDEDLSDWTKVRLEFSREPGKDNMSRSNDPNDYVVHDPLLEKGKEKFNRMQAKQKRREREWAGKSLT